MSGQLDTNIDITDLDSAVIWFPNLLTNSAGEPATGKPNLTPAARTCDVAAYNAVKDQINNMVEQLENVTTAPDGPTTMKNLKARIDGNMFRNAFTDCAATIDELLNLTYTTKEILSTQCIGAVGSDITNDTDPCCSAKAAYTINCEPRPITATVGEYHF
jgi:hypothetical protein